MPSTDTRAPQHLGVGAERFEAMLAALAPVGLEQLNARAALQTRVDRKYVAPLPVAIAMLGEIAGNTAILEIEGRRTFGYSSVYFDTSDLRCFAEHRQGRRRRFKVRTRRYLDAGACTLEVKCTAPRGGTIKHRCDYPVADAATLTAGGARFVAETLGERVDVAALAPSLVTDYQRATLLDVRAGSRMTIDTNLTFAAQGAEAQTPADTVVIETKSVGCAGRADAVLWRLGVRPVSVSKYCIGIALTHPELPANRWNRLLRHYFRAGHDQVPYAFPAAIK